MKMVDEKDISPVEGVRPVERTRETTPGSALRPGGKTPRAPARAAQAEERERVDISISQGRILAVRHGRRGDRRSKMSAKVYELFDEERLPLGERRQNPSRRDEKGSRVLVVRVDDAPLGPETVGKKVYLRLG